MFVHRERNQLTLPSMKQANLSTEQLKKFLDSSKYLYKFATINLSQTFFGQLYLFLTTKMDFRTDFKLAFYHFNLQTGHGFKQKLVLCLYTVLLRREKKPYHNKLDFSALGLNLKRPFYFILYKKQTWSKYMFGTTLRYIKTNEKLFKCLENVLNSCKK